MISLLTTSIATVFLLALYMGYRWLLPKPIPGIPYNAEAVNTIMGDLPSLMAELKKSGDLMLWCLNQNLRSGSPICQVFMRPLSKPTLVVADYWEACDIQQRSRDFDRSDMMSVIFNGIVKDTMLPLKTGPVWKAHRRLLADTMSPAFLNEVAAPNVYASTLRFVDLWTAKARLAKGRPFESREDFARATLDAVLAFSFGTEFPHSAMKPQLQKINGLAEEDIESVAGMDEEIKFPDVDIDDEIDSMVKLVTVMEKVQNSPVPQLNWLMIKAWPKFRRWAKSKHACIRHEVEKAVHNHNENVSSTSDSWVRSAVDHIIDREDKQAKKDGRKPDFFSPMVIDELYAFIVAGHDSTSTTMAWASKLLADNPGAQTRLRQSLRSAFSVAFSEKRVPSVEEINEASIPLLDATVEEILRTGGTIPFGGRQATRDTTVFGYHVPKGTVVLYMNNGPSMVTPAYKVDENMRCDRTRDDKEHGRFRSWNDDDIGQFKPERWLVKQTNDKKHDDAAQSGDKEDLVFDKDAGPTLPFGRGIRGCFGRRLAYIELKILLIMLIWNFELLECPKEMSGYQGYLSVVYKPKQSFVRLKQASYED